VVAVVVAELPKLRPDLIVRRIPGPDDISYVVKDPVRRKFVRFPEAAGRLLAFLDGKASLSGVQQRLRAAGVDAPGLEALEGFVQQLRAMDLLELSPAERMEHQLEQLRTERRLRVRSRNAFGSILHARFSFWDPDRWMDRVVPRLRFFWTPGFFVVSLAAILLATGILWAHWERFQGELHRLFSGRAGWHEYVAFVLILLVVIAIHELGHGLTCKQFGGHVHEIGFLLMYFMPCFYCNVDDAWLFERRSERLWVTAAGGHIQLSVGALATFTWWLTTSGHPVNTLALQTALIASVSSVAVNLNPLIKLDGYYGLTDYLGIPNLREHSFRYVRALFRRLLFRRPPEGPELTSRRRRIYLTYGLLAGAYSMAILVLFGGRTFEFLVTRWRDWGVAAFLVIAACLLVPPAWRWRRAAGRKPSGGAASLRARVSASVAYRSFFPALALVLLAVVPRWAMPVRLAGMFEPGAPTVFYAPEDAQVVQVLCEEGQRVRAGQPLVKLRSLELESELTRARLGLATSRLREQQAQLAGDLAARQAERRRAQTQQEQLDQLEQRSARLTLIAPRAGACLTPRPRELLGRAVQRGAPLVMVGVTTQLLAVARIGPGATGEARAHAPALVMPDALPGTVLRGRVRDLLPAGGRGGGFRLTVPVANPGALQPGMSARIKVYGPKRSLLGHLREGALRLLRADLWW
jgi:putative peptide zinc metalloprotease protein